MRRPLPTLPRGPRGLRRRSQTGQPVHLLTCPRVSPEWELAALRVLMKPHEWTRGVIEHRDGAQPWPSGHARTVRRTVADVAERLSFEAALPLHLPDAGDFWFVVEVPDGHSDLARALAVVLSRRLPGLWLTLDRLYVRDGRFFRRRRDNTFKFRLVPATTVHLPRAVRSALRELATQSAWA